ncbi:uncharacterized protein VTP21DRAFT_8355 [Calcarisporiella thermophila]|uniref:uncharacterized protein n=1 Tax=Calcarisporiella thermophila TaxID=911321 RepID=UPI0037438158
MDPPGSALIIFRPHLFHCTLLRRANPKPSCLTSARSTRAFPMALGRSPSATYPPAGEGRASGFAGALPSRSGRGWTHRATL